MKKILFLIMPLLAALCAYAQTDVLILSDTTEYNITSSKQTFNLEKPCARLTLNAKHTASSVTTNKTLMGNLTIEQNVGGSWETLYEDNPGNVTVGERTMTVLGQTIKLGEYEEAVTYEMLSLNLNRHATQIRFSGSTLNDKQIKNLCAYMATYVEITPKSLDFGEMVVWSEPVTRWFTVEHCNVQRLSVSTSNSDFAPSVTQLLNSGIAQYGVDTIEVTFTPNIMGQHSGAVYVSNNTLSDSVIVRGKVTKRTPIFTFAETTLTVGDMVAVPLTSDCENALMLGSCDASVVAVSCGQLIALTPGEAVVTAMQLGDDSYWNNRVETYNVVVLPKTPTAVARVQEESPLAFDGYALRAMGQGEMRVELFDAAGRLIDEATGCDALSLRAIWPAGTYTAVLTQGTNRHSEKIVVK